MRSLISRFSILLLLVLAGLIASSCVAEPPPVIDPPAAGIQVLPDTTDPATLNVTVTINEEQNDSDKLSVITVQFSTIEIRNQNYVKFVNGEKVKCNGVLLGFGDTAYSARVHPVNNSYTCTYRWARGTSVIISVLARTQLSPALVPDASGHKFIVRYRPDQTHRCPIQVAASDSSQAFSGPSVMEEGNGVYTGPDRSALGGQGTLVMTRVCRFKLIGSSTAFNTVGATYTSTATSEVVWFGPP